MLGLQLVPLMPRLPLPVASSRTASMPLPPASSSRRLQLLLWITTAHPALALLSSRGHLQQLPWAQVSPQARQ